MLRGNHGHNGLSGGKGHATVVFAREIRRPITLICRMMLWLSATQSMVVMALFGLWVSKWFALPVVMHHWLMFSRKGRGVAANTTEHDRIGLWRTVRTGLRPMCGPFPLP